MRRKISLEIAQHIYEMYPWLGVTGYDVDEVRESIVTFIPPDRAEMEIEIQELSEPSTGTKSTKTSIGGGLKKALGLDPTHPILDAISLATHRIKSQTEE